MGRSKVALAEKKATQLAKQDGMHAMGGVPGLYLLVRGNSRSWILRYMVAGVRRDHGLGSFLDLSLAEARERARERRKLLAQGIDPIRTERAAKGALVPAGEGIKLEKALDLYIEAHGDSWRNPKHRAQWGTSVRTHAKPLLRADVADIDVAALLRVLEPIWKTIPETANRVRGRLEAVLDWSTVRGYRKGDNPARWRGHLDQILPARTAVKKVEHFAALPFAEMVAFFAELRKQQGEAARAVEFAILTAARSGEVRGATWSEVDLKAAVWTVPAERMKAKREHRVPLSPEAVRVLKAQLAKRRGDLIFPGAKGDKPLSDMSLTAVLRRMKREDITVHGFRSTFRDWCAETTNFPSYVVEMALAHTIGDKVEAAYRRGELLEKRAELMRAWATYCTKKPKKQDDKPVAPAPRRQRGSRSSTSAKPKGK